MKKQKEDLVKVPTSTYRNITGALGLINNNGAIEWERCRDRFQTATDNGAKSFLFFHKNNVGQDVIDFIRTFEQACNCPPDQELDMKRTTDKNVLWIGMSDWWRYRVRRSLLTALLRCGQEFTDKTGPGFVAALNSQPYLSQTKDAVEYFMSGHTACKIQRNTHFPGWQLFFQSKPKSQIEACLVKLKKRKEAKNEADVQESGEDAR